MANKFPLRPAIRKMGTIGCGVVETTPIVWKGELYRFEVVRGKRLVEKTATIPDDFPDSPCLRFVHVRTNSATPYFAENHTFGFPFIVDDVMYAVAGDKDDWGADKLDFYRSKDLVNWEMYTSVHLPGWKTYNMNIAKMGDTYTLLVEIGAPEEEAGEFPFTFRFLQSKDMTNWELTPRVCFP